MNNDQNSNQQSFVESSPENWDLDLDLDIISGDIKQSDLIRSMEKQINKIRNENHSNQDIADDLPLTDNSQSQSQSQSEEEKTSTYNDRIKKEQDLLDTSLDKIKEEYEDSDEATNTGSTNNEPLTIVEAIKELQLLDIPEEYANKEELTDEDLYFLSEHTRKKTKENILNEIGSRIEDQYEKELFEYWKVPVKNKSLPEYKEMLDDIEYFSNLDTRDVQNQRELLTFYLRDGLDPNNPAHAFRLQNLNQDVENILSSDYAEEQTAQAKRHVQVKINTKRLEEKKRVIELAKQEELREKQEYENSKKWFDTVNDYINNQNWDQSIKQQMFNEIYGEVKVGYGNNQTVKPSWLAKLDLINNDPKLHIEFIKFLNNFDMQSRTFKTNISEKEIKKAAVDKINSLTNRKIKRPSSTQKINTRNDRQGPSRIILDPMF